MGKTGVKLTDPTNISNKLKPRTSKASDWPQGKFKKKNCKTCGEEFEPISPCNYYCSDNCRDLGYTSRYLVRTYGIDIHDYMDMLEEQKHVCAICGSEGFALKKDHRLTLVVDHDHNSGEVRGLLCPNCNRALGLLQDDPDIVAMALTYLTKEEDDDD